MGGCDARKVGTRFINFQQETDYQGMVCHDDNDHNFPPSLYIDV